MSLLWFLMFMLNCTLFWVSGLLVQKLTDDYMKKIDVIYKQKEKVWSISTELFLVPKPLLNYEPKRWILVGFDLGSSFQEPLNHSPTCIHVFLNCISGVVKGVTKSKRLREVLLMVWIFKLYFRSCWRCDQEQTLERSSRCELWNITSLVFPRIEF